MPQLTESYNFQQIGKKLPYQQPSGDYFEQSQRKINEHIRRIDQRRHWYYGIAASVLMLLGIVPLAQFFVTSTNKVAEEINLIYSNSSSSDNWSSFAEADIFLDNLD